MLKTQDWQKLAALPADTFCRPIPFQRQTCIGPDCGFFADQFLRRPARCSANVAEAETLQAVSGITDVSALNGTLKDLVSQWSKYWPANAGETKASKSNGNKKSKPAT